MGLWVKVVILGIFVFGLLNMQVYEGEAYNETSQHLYIDTKPSGRPAMETSSICGRGTNRKTMKVFGLIVILVGCFALELKKTKNI